MATAGFFTILDSVDSTNNYAMGRLHEGMASHGMGWFAKEQTAGKGQRGKSWKMEKDQSIAMSLVLEPACLPAGPGGQIRDQFHLSALVALSCFEFFSIYAGDETKIKWPNDLYWRDRKAGGVLIENKYLGRLWKWSVVGMGININQTSFDRELPNPVSLKQITGKTFDAVELGMQLYELLMQKIEENKPFEEIMSLYNQNLYKANKQVTLKKSGIEFETVIKEVSQSGKLVTVDAIENEFDFGEVEWVL